ncbi:MAG: OmpA family protein [Elusimicrobiota bacterium]
MNSTSKGLLFLLLGLALAGCPPKKKQTPAVEAPVEEAPVDGDMAGRFGARSALEIGGEWITVPELSAVYFETNSADLAADAREALKTNAQVLKAALQEAPALQIRVEGHCDQRGTVEYNLALGQRRANALRDYYKSLGVRGNKLATVSFGEERLVCRDESEDCWSRNRRGETTLKSSGAAIRIPLDKLP